jgi:hypothetical protein
VIRPDLLQQANAARTRYGSLMLVALALSATPGHAQRLVSFGVRADNDGFNYLSRGYSDRDYTSGTEFSFGFDDRLLLHRVVRGYSSWCAAQSSHCESRVSLGQKIFTPGVESADPVAGERPFAGWLYLRLEESIVSGRNGHRFAVEVGVTGKPSLAQANSQGLHDLIGFHQLVGWENQLRFEPGLSVGWDYDRRLTEAPFGSHNRVTVTRTTGLTLGNVLTEVHAGLTLDIGFGLRAGAPPCQPRVNFFLSASERFVLRNLFLDGNTFTTSVSVDRRATVFAYTGGVVFRLGRWHGGYSVTTSAKEYHTQSDRHAFSTFTVSYGFH